MRRVTFVLTALALVAACGGGGGSSSSLPPSTLPGQLVPSTATSASVAVTTNGQVRLATVDRDVLDHVLPLLVRRQFEPVEPLASYGFDDPRATITFTLSGGDTLVLQVGDEEFDHSASYVMRNGDTGTIWIVLNESLAPILDAAGVSASSGAQG